MGCFPENWKVAKILPIVKPGRETSTETSKYRPISLLNTEGKILEKLLSKRIMHHMYRTEYLNKNQYGFTPKEYSGRRHGAKTIHGTPHIEREKGWQ